ncbi:MAG: glycosyltransferase N-terminal domain-containing protein [Phycisphaerales bacterium]
MNGLDLLYLALGVVSAPLWARKKRDGWRERFGHIDRMLTREPTGKPRVLLHAVSVGEVSALRQLVPMLTRDADVIVSTTTDTGLARAKSLYADRCDVVRYPLDASWMVRRFLDRVQPDAVGLVELELWPNFLKACRSRGVPVAVINGRVSERSFKGYRRFRAIARPLMFARLEAAGAQDAAYRDRLAALGVPDARLAVTGSMKWDSVDAAGDPPPPSERAVAIARGLGIDLDRPLIVAGSTGPGEEALLHDACPADVQLLCAPRKPERFDDAAGALPGCVRRSSGETRPGNRFLLDTIGELSAAYELADVVVVGRSFGDLYGSDPTEPAALGKPVVIGPAVGDFESAVATLRDADAIVQADRIELARTLEGLMRDPAQRDRLGRAARAAVRDQQGASARHARLLLALCRLGVRSDEQWSGGSETILKDHA